MRRRLAALRPASLVLALGACGGSSSGAAAPTLAASTSAPTAVPAPAPAVEAQAAGVLAIYAVDDTLPAFAAGAALPAGFEARKELVPAGDRADRVENTFAWTALRPGEAPEAALGRLRAAGLPALPDGARFVHGLTFVKEGDQAPAPSGARTYVVRGGPIVRASDVATATVEDWQDQAHVKVTLTPDAAARFGDATKSWLYRRLAIVAFDVVTADPVVLAPITGGTLGVPVRPGSKESMRAEAERLAAALGPR